jgi:hypothetical protein
MSADPPDTDELSSSATYSDVLPGDQATFGYGCTAPADKLRVRPRRARQDGDPLVFLAIRFCWSPPANLRERPPGDHVPVRRRAVFSWRPAGDARSMSTWRSADHVPVPRRARRSEYNGGSF